MIEIGEKGSKVFIYNKGKFLLQKRDDKKGIYYPNSWGLFGGKLELNEKPEIGLKRELIEEINWKDPELIILTTFHDKRHNTIIYLFSAKIEYLEYKGLIQTEGQKMKFFDKKEIMNQKLIPEIYDGLHNMLESIDLYFKSN
tara:strand:- start:1346 stop:1771 length:426 start_codon:yes stop_codon:yes gene_type:complete